MCLKPFTQPKQPVLLSKAIIFQEQLEKMVLRPHLPNAKQKTLELLCKSTFTENDNFAKNTL